MGSFVDRRIVAVTFGKVEYIRVGIFIGDYEPMGFPIGKEFIIGTTESITALMLY
ncbi:hypothetical protein HMPREF9073_02163 [Capnocytophaga sp. oral taxon 326 str. F0382]|nr:hypothetical protein HMPREF9073_02163 [Capnocytophaga sp. oral taxon 326 str. F0382]